MSDEEVSAGPPIPSTIVYDHGIYMDQAGNTYMPHETYGRLICRELKPDIRIFDGENEKLWQDINIKPMLYPNTLGFDQTLDNNIEQLTRALTGKPAGSLTVEGWGPIAEKCDQLGQLPKLQGQHVADGATVSPISSAQAAEREPDVPVR